MKNKGYAKFGRRRVVGGGGGGGGGGVGETRSIMGDVQMVKF